jgi:hypothetical protein
MLEQITEQQLSSRWDSLPSILKEAIVSETNSDFVWKTAGDEHLPEDKIRIVSKLTGYVLMGFIHPEELTDEISSAAEIDKRVAAAIADPINKKVFQPMRGELENIYAPAGEEPQAPKPIAIEEIIKPASVTAAPIPAPSPTGQPPEPKKESVFAPIPVVKESASIPISTPPVPAAAPVASPAPAPAFKPAGRQFPVNMFSVKAAAPDSPKPPQEASLAEDRPTPVIEKQIPPIMPQAEQVTSSPLRDTSGQATPFILHQESESQPIAPTKSTFRVGLSEEQFGKMEQKWTAPPRPAQIETGIMGDSARKPSEPVAQSQAGLGTRIVHYGEMKTPLPPTPQTRSGARPSEEFGNPFEVLGRSGNNLK